MNFYSNQGGGKGVGVGKGEEQAVVKGVVGVRSVLAVER